MGTKELMNMQESSESLQMIALIFLASTTISTPLESIFLIIKKFLKH